MSTIKEVIENNEWKPSSFRDSTDIKQLFASGIITNASEQAQAVLNVMDYNNVRSTITVGMGDDDWVEQNLSSASLDRAVPVEPKFHEETVKTFYGYKSWAIHTIQEDLLNTTQSKQLVIEHVGRYWATQYNKIIGATVSGMSDIPEITQGDGTANLSHRMVIDALSKKGDMGFNQSHKMYMNSTTMYDILRKQKNGTIDEELITKKCGQATVVKDGGTQQVQFGTPQTVYDGATPIVVDDVMKDGIISLVWEGAFAFAQKNLSDPLLYNGAREESWETNNLYILHPVGFSFKGKYDAKSPNPAGLTLAELRAGGLYELKVAVKLSPIINIKVKIGA